MALPVTLLLLNILNFVMAVIVTVYASSARKITSVRWMLLLVISFCVVSFCTLGGYISRDIEVQTLFLRMRFLTLGLLPPSWFLFIVSVYGKWKWLKNPWIVALFFIPGSITTLLTLVPQWNDFVIRDFSPVVVNGFSVLKYEGGVWFPYHYITATTLVILSVILGGYFFIKERGIRRRQIVLLITSSSLAAGVDIYCVVTNSPLRWLLLSSGTFIFCQLGIVISAWKLNLLNIMPLAMKRVFQEFPDPVFVIDGEKIIRAVNKAAIDFFGLKKVEGENFSDLLPNVKLCNGEVCLHNQFHEPHYFILSLEELVTSREDPSGQVVFFKEITVQKSIESRLNENLEFKARLLALVSHDLAGHIESQALITSSLQSEVEGTSLKNRVELLASSTMASQGFVDNIVSWVQGQGSHFELIRKEFEWNILIRECIEDLEYAWKPKKIDIQFESTHELLVGQGDSNMLASVVRNILSNAIRATPDNNQIQIFLSTFRNSVEVSFVDHGIGMNDELISDLNNDSTDLTFKSEMKTGYKSYGIGLKIVKYFISRHRGKFLIESQLGSGTRVSIGLPLR